MIERLLIHNIVDDSKSILLFDVFSLRNSQIVPVEKS